MRGKFDIICCRAIKYVTACTVAVLFFAAAAVITYGAVPEPGELIYSRSQFTELPKDYNDMNAMGNFTLLSYDGAKIVTGTNGIPVKISSANTDNNFAAVYRLDLSKLWQGTNKGDYKIRAVFDVRNAKRYGALGQDWLAEDDLAVFKIMQYDQKLNAVTIDGENSPEIKGDTVYRDVDTGWVDVLPWTENVDLSFGSRAGEKDDNCVYYENIRVYIYDGAGLKAESIIYPKANLKNFYTPGEVVNFQVMFNEPVKITGTAPDLPIKASSINNPNTSVTLMAKCNGISSSSYAPGSQVDYSLTLPTNMELTNFHVDESALGRAVGSGGISTDPKLAMRCFTDFTGNGYEGPATQAFSNDCLPNIIVDGLAPTIEKIEMSVAAGSSVGLGGQVFFDVTFSEALGNEEYLLHALQLKLNNGGYAIGDPKYPGGDRKKVRFIYTPQKGEDTQKLDVYIDPGSSPVEGEYSNISLKGTVYSNLEQKIVDYYPYDKYKNELTDPKVKVLKVVNGNTGYACEGVIIVDTTPPTISAELQNGADLSFRTLKIKITDNDGGAGRTSYTFDVPGLTYSARTYIDTSSMGSYTAGKCDGPGDVEHYLDIRVDNTTAGTTDYTIEINAMDRVGNTSTKSIPVIFDREPPGISIVQDSGDRKRFITAVSDAGSLKLCDIKYQWVTATKSAGGNTNWVPDENNWCSFTNDASTGVSFSNLVTTYVAPAGSELYIGKLFIKASDVSGNTVIKEGSPVLVDNRAPGYELYLPDNAAEISPSFNITVTGSAIELHETDVEVQWVPAGSDQDNANYLKVVGDTERAAGIPAVAIATEEIQKHFNNGKVFNGEWTLYLRAKLASDTTGATYKYLDSPLTFKFDTEAPVIAIGEVSSKPSGVAPAITVVVNDGVYPVNTDSIDSKYWLTSPTGETIFTKYLPDQPFTTNIADLQQYGSGTYTLHVSAQGYDGLAPTVGTKSFGMDFSEPTTGSAIGIPDYVKDIHVQNITFKCRDISTANSSERFNYAVDGVWKYDSDDISKWAEGLPHYITYGTNIGGAAGTTDYECVSPQVAIDIPDIDGEHVLSWKFADLAGNVSQEFTKKLILDRVAPDGSLSFDKLALTHENINASIASVTDDYSIPGAIQAFSEASNSWVPAESWSVVIDKNGIFNCKIRDEAGNEKTLSAMVDWLDKTAPVIDKVLFDYKYDTGSMKPVLNDLVKMTVSAYDPDTSGGRKPVQLYYYTENDVTWHKMVECDTPTLQIIKSSTVDGIDTWTIYHSFKPDGTADQKIRYIGIKAIDAAGNEYISDGTDDYWYYSDKALSVSSYYNDTGYKCGPAVFEVWFNQDVAAAVGDFVEIPESFDGYGDAAESKDKHGYDICNRGSGFAFKFYKNGTYDLTYADRFGNVQTLKDYFVVTQIDDSIQPVITTTPDKKTKDTVTVTLDASTLDNEYIHSLVLPAGITIADTEGEKDITVGGAKVKGYKKVILSASSNGTIEYKIFVTGKGIAEKGAFEVQSIDTQPPTAQIVYTPDGTIDNDGKVHGNVTATLVKLRDNSGVPGIKFINAGGSTHTFINNGSFDFILEDEAGNRTVLTASVNNIDHTPLSGSDTTAPGFELRYYAIMPGGSVDVQKSDGTFKPVNRDVHVLVIPRDESSVTATSTVAANPESVLCNDAGMEYIFSDAATVNVKLTDASNNVTNLSIVVNNIDKIPPTGKVTYSQDNTTRNVTAVLDASDDKGTAGIRFLNSSGLSQISESKVSHLFTDNGSFNFMFTDEAGNRVTVPADVRWIDRAGPVVTTSSSVPLTTPVNTDVNLIITPSEPYEKAEILGTRPDGVSLTLGVSSIIVTFSKNAAVTLRVTDRNGNYTDIPVEVACIDKTPPTADIKVDYDMAYGKPAKGYATLSLENISETDVTVENNSRSKQMLVKKNGTYSFIISDRAGNRSTVTKVISSIDNEVPKLSLAYSTTALTKNPVTVSLTADEDIVVEEQGNSIVVAKGSSYDVVMTENGTHNFYACDKNGNSAYIMASVRNIDNIAPIIKFSGPAKLVFIQDGAYNLRDCSAEDNHDGTIDRSKIIINNNGFDISKPGTYIVKYRVSDSAGNIGSVERTIVVLGSDTTKIYINNMDPSENSGLLIVNTSKIDIRLLNEKMSSTLKWKAGRLTAGQMKTGANKVTGDSFSVTETGWYTLMLQTQEKEITLIYIYVSSL